jgi:hypothetical protein
MTLPPLPTARSGLAAAALEGQIYVTGGEVLDSSGRTFTELEVLDSVTAVWRTAAPMPAGRHGLAAVALGEQIYVLAGGPTAGLSVSATNEAFVP